MKEYIWDQSCVGHLCVITATVTSKGKSHTMPGAQCPTGREDTGWCYREDTSQKGHSEKLIFQLLWLNTEETYRDMWKEIRYFHES